VGCKAAPGTLSQRVERDAAIRANAGDNCTSWPECTPRVLGVGIEDTSSEFTLQCVATQKCRMLVRRPEPPSTETKREFADIFGGFSLREGLRTVGTSTPGRRRCSEGQKQGSTPWSDDCDPVYSKYMEGRRLLQADPVYTPHYRDLILASRGIRAAMQIGEGSYANEQFQGLRRDVGALMRVFEQARATIGPLWKGESSNSRTLLSATDDIKCLANSATASDGLRPNTYPCCRGRW